MARLEEQQINDIRAKADIIEIVSRYVPLTKRGKSYWCTCPFHDDHDPSMSVSSDKQIYKCFVCGAGGNVFTFVQKYEQISFIEAVYKVAEYTGIHMDVPLIISTQQIDPHKAALYKVCQETIDFTHYSIQSVQAKHVYEYLTKRGLTNDIINRFELGFNPANDEVYKYLHAKKYRDEDILGAGVSRITGIGMKDVFANRIMIPIHDEQGHPVGFSARRILENEDAKYINTQETDIYTKGNLIFNYHRAKSDAKKKNRVYIVEGAMDVLAFEKVGLKNAMATLGTACTKEQIQLLKRLSVPIVLCYDGDKAGKHATYKFGKLALEQHLKFDIVNNPYGLDPDEIIDVYGKEELIRIADQTLSWIDFSFEYLATRYNLDNYTQKKEFAVEIASMIEKLSEEFEKTNFYLKLKQLTGFDMQHQVEEHQLPHEKQVPYQKRTFLTYPKEGRLLAEWEILTQMLNGISASNIFKEELGFLKDETCNKLAMYIVDYYRTHVTIAVADLLDMIKEENVKQLLLDIANWELGDCDVRMNVLQGAISKIKACLLDDKIAMLNKQIEKTRDPIEKAKLADNRTIWIKERKAMIEKGGSY